jgi:hypothetical protein
VQHSLLCLKTLAKMATDLHTTLDDVVFGEAYRCLSDELKLQFEALSQFDEEYTKAAKAILESLILKLNAKRAFATG